MIVELYNFLEIKKAREKSQALFIVRGFA